MKIAVLGTGAIGGYYGGKLAKAGNDVSFVARGINAEALKRQGLRVESYEGDFHLPSVRVVDQLDKLGSVDLILFTIKSTGTIKVAEQLKQSIDGRYSILCMQNGVDNEEILAEAVGPDRVLSGSAYISASLASPGVVRHDAMGTLSIGEWYGDRTDRVQQINDLFQQAGINCRISPDIRQTKWEKLCWNITFNPITALTFAKVGHVLDNPGLRSVAEAVMNEYVQVAQGKGIEIREKVKANTFSNSESIREHDTSMLQDRKSRKPMELESICGSVIRWGEELGVDTPVLKTLYQSLKFIDLQNIYQ